MPLALNTIEVWSRSLPLSQVRRRRVVTRNETTQGQIARRVPVRKKGEPMKNVLMSCAAILLSFGLVGTAVAQAQAPKSTDLPPKATGGSEVQPEKSKAKASQSGRTNKKPDASVDERKGKNVERPPRGVEGPEARKTKKSDASAKPPQSKGAAGTDAAKEQKKP